MDYAKPLPLGESGRPDFNVEELTYKTQHHVDVYNGDVKTPHRHGVAMLTSHRLCWISASTPIDTAVHWHLGIVHSVSQEEAGFFAGHAKIVLRFRKLGSDDLAPGHLKLSFQAGGRDEFLEHLNNALRRKQWAVPLAAPAAPRSTSEPGVRLPGIAGIQASAAAKQAEAAALASEALTDLRSLAEHAKSLVRLAEEYAAESAARKRAVAAAGDAEAAGGAATGADISSLVTGLGIVNPVTRAAAGAQYLEEVARQLAQFLRPALERAGGLLSLADVYSVYNRARHTDLISPDDLVAAAQLLAPLRLGMELHTFPSKLVVIRLDSFSPQGVVLRLRELLQRRGGGRLGGPPYPFVSAFDLASEWRTPLQIALQLLLTAEGQGAVCRDDSISGLRFYANAFCEA